MRTVAILQARMTSARLPGKVVMDIAGRPMLAHIVRRLQRTSGLHDIVIATTSNEADDQVVTVAEHEGARWYRGSEEDVLGRYVGAARAARADVVVRVTADCPLLDPAVVGRVVEALRPGVDYASNVIERTYPVGLDAEALTQEALLRMDKLATSPEAREHVTWLLRYERPDLFARHSVTDSEDNSDLRWVIDKEEDLGWIRHLYEALDLGRSFRPFRDVVAYERAHGRYRDATASAS